MIELLLAITISIVIHTSVMAACLSLFGVKIKEISFGVGPTLVKLGVFKFQPIPISGFVKALDSRDKDFTNEEKTLAFNHKPVWMQVFTPLSGNVAILLITYFIAGEYAIAEFLLGFKQIVLGAIHPFSVAQDIIEKAKLYLDHNNLINIIVITLTKYAAFNLLPLSMLNGGSSIVSILKMGKPVVSWEDSFAKISMVVLLFILVSWIVSIVYFLW